MKKWFFLVFTLFALNLSWVSAQSYQIIKPASIDTLVNRAKAKNLESSTMDGYRVQLFSGSDRNKANLIKSQFKSDLPEVPVYITYRQPYFKLRVGDFRNRIEATQFFLKLEDNYENLLIVPDKINFPNL